MKDLWLAINIAIYEARYALMAMFMAIGSWLVFAWLTPTKYLDLFVYALVGYYWLGGVVVPWIERKLEKLFS